MAVPKTCSACIPASRCTAPMIAWTTDAIILSLTVVVPPEKTAALSMPALVPISPKFLLASVVLRISAQSPRSCQLKANSNM